MENVFKTSLLLAALAAPSFASPDVACNYGSAAAWAQVNVSVVGTWQMSHHAGYYIAGPMMMPFPASGDSETMNIDMSADGRLFASNPNVPTPIEFVWADEPPWSFEADANADGVPAPLLSSTDIELMMGCKVAKLARLIGHTQVTVDGVTMDMTLRLIVLGATSMYGIFHTSGVSRGITVKSWRAVTLTR